MKNEKTERLKRQIQLGDESVIEELLRACERHGDLETAVWLRNLSLERGWFWSALSCKITIQDLKR